MKKIIRKVSRLIPDKIYISLMYLKYFHRFPDLKKPQTFNEKLQWLKLYDRRPEYTKMVDKYAVKRYIADIIGEEYLIPTLGVWNAFDDIDFDKLPNQFVLKCTHDSHSIIICKDKSNFDIRAARVKIEKALKRNFYYYGREWPYKNVPARIIAEKYMKDAHSEDLRDYKFFCFNGEVKFLYLSEGLDNPETGKISYVSLNWEPLSFCRDDYKPFSRLPDKPQNLDQMIKFAAMLSKGIPHIRVDFYEINNQIYFGELTLYSGSGLTMFNPPSADLEIGKLLKLPQ